MQDSWVPKVGTGEEGSGSPGILFWPSSQDRAILTSQYFICLCTYIHTCMHACIHTSMHTYIHTHIHAYIHTYIHRYMHACIHAYMHTYLPPYMPTYLPPYMPIYNNRPKKIESMSPGFSRVQLLDLFGLLCTDLDAQRFTQKNGENVRISRGY